MPNENFSLKEVKFFSSNKNDLTDKLTDKSIITTIDSSKKTRKDADYLEKKPNIDDIDLDKDDTESKVIERLKFLKATLKQILTNYESKV